MPSSPATRTRPFSEKEKAKNDLNFAGPANKIHAADLHDATSQDAENFSEIHGGRREGVQRRHRKMTPSRRRRKAGSKKDRWFRAGQRSRGGHRDCQYGYGSRPRGDNLLAPATISWAGSRSKKASTSCCDAWIKKRKRCSARKNECGIGNCIQRTSRLRIGGRSRRLLQCAARPPDTPGKAREEIRPIRIAKGGGAIGGAVGAAAAVGALAAFGALTVVTGVQQQ